MVGHTGQTLPDLVAAITSPDEVRVSVNQSRDNGLSPHIQHLEIRWCHAVGVQFLNEFL